MLKCNACGALAEWAGYVMFICAYALAHFGIPGAFNDPPQLGIAYFFRRCLARFE